MNRTIRALLMLLVISGYETRSGCKITPCKIIDSYIYLQKEGREKAGREKEEWQIIWQDNFDGPELDTSKWTRIPPGNPDWKKHMSTNDQCGSNRMIGYLPISKNQRRLGRCNIRTTGGVK